MKACRDCRWAKVEVFGSSKYWFCTNKNVREKEENEIIDYLNGTINYVRIDINQARRRNFCGKEAQYWEENFCEAK